MDTEADEPDFELLAPISHIEVIARGTGVHLRHFLNRTYGRGNWRKLKGQAVIKMKVNEFTGLAEIHWFEAHGIGRRKMKRKRWIT
ncbi:MAG: hypothetical protein R2911_41215 [Caldilineaceae bacterium]